MNSDTVKKAEAFIRHSDVVIDAKNTVWPSFIQFFVYGKQKHIVWRRVKNNEIVWKCNASGDFGCCMANKINTKPLCSHTLACELFLKRLKKRL